MKRLIIIGGKAPSSISLDLSEYSAVIAADSGYDTACDLGITITDAVGDFDSTSRRDELIRMGFVPCSHDKDYTDTELAVMKGEGDYDLIGGGEGRIDHTLDLISMMRRLGAPAVWYMASDTVVRIDGPVEVSLPPGAGVSFFSLSGKETIVRSEGLIWELDGFPLSDMAVSLSNRSEQGCFRIFPSGTLMMRVDPEVYPQCRFSPIAL